MSEKKTSRKFNKLKCPICKCEDGALMGDNETLFECNRDNSHIWSYHNEKCKSHLSSTFKGWIRRKDYEESYNTSDDSSDSEITSATFAKHKNFKIAYDPKKLTDCSSFLWNCPKCKEDYINMYCG